MEWLIYFLLGGFAGLLAGIFGVGGGAIVVPVLIIVFNLMSFAQESIVHIALGTSFATIVVTSASSVQAHQKYAAIDWLLWRRLSPGLVLGVLVGSYVAMQADGANLQIAIALFFIAVALQMLVQIEPRKLFDVKRGSWLQAIAGSVIGTVSAFFGIGGGSLTVPWLTSTGEPIRKAVATSAACGLSIAVVGSLSYGLLAGDVVNSVSNTGARDSALNWQTGYVYWPAFFGIALTSVPTAKLGARWAQNLPEQTMRRLFGLLLLLLSLQLLYPYYSR